MQIEDIRIEAGPGLIIRIVDGLGNIRVNIYLAALVNHLLLSLGCLLCGRCDPMPVVNLRLNLKTYGLVCYEELITLSPPQQALRRHGPATDTQLPVRTLQTSH